MPRTPLQRRRGPSAGRLRQVPWLLAAPAIVAVVALRYAPTIAGAGYAFTDWNGVSSSAEWVGFSNFSAIFKDSAAKGALFHTLELAAVDVVLVNVLGLALALALRSHLKTRNVLRALFFLPAVLGPLAVSYVWQYVFTYDGALNKLLAAVGLDSWQRPWLGDPHWALWTVLVVLVWQFVGLTMVIYLAGLQSIPDDLDDAAAVDGAPRLMRFRRITLPMLAPALTVNLTLTLVYGLGVFDQVIALTNGGPDNASQTLATEVYQSTFEFGRFGYGAALALILTVLIAVLAVTQTALLRRREVVY
jgi:raffinose/stachyose/melibiose transport system permease protein